MDFLDGDDAGVVPIQLAKGVLEGTGQNFLIRYMEDIFIHLFGALSVQSAQHIIGPVCVGSHKAVIPQLVVDVLLIGLNPAILVADQSIGHSVLVDPAVCRHPALVSRTAHQGYTPFMERGVYGSEDTGVVAGAEVDTNRIPAGAIYRLNILFQTLYVLDWHGRRLFQYVGGGSYSL